MALQGRATGLRMAFCNQVLRMFTEGCVYMRFTFVPCAVIGAALVAGLSSCSGGTVATTPLATPSPTSVSGDLLNFAPSRGWNYLVTNIKNVYTYPNGEINPGVPVTTATISLYVYPTPIDGTTILEEVAVSGQATSALTAPLSQQAIIGAAGFSTTGTTYTATRFANYTTTAAIPAVVLTSPLVLGATATPFVGVTQTVTAIGTVPGESACPTPTALGATVQYTQGSQTGTIDFVPGCGATQILDNHGGIWTLQSIGSYPAAASNYTITAVAQQVGGANMLDTLRSIFGLEQGGPIRRSITP